MSYKQVYPPQGRKRKAKAQKINWKTSTFYKQDKVFAIYFKNDTLNKSETDFSQKEKIIILKPKFCILYAFVHRKELDFDKQIR